MKIRPLHDRIVVKRIPDEDRKTGGIVIPDTAVEKPQQGRVVEAGSEGRLSAKLKTGDTILFGKYAGEETAPDGEQLFIIPEDEVFAISSSDEPGVFVATQSTSAFGRRDIVRPESRTER